MRTRKIVAPERRRRSWIKKEDASGYFRLADGHHTLEVSYARAAVGLTMRSEPRRRTDPRHCYVTLWFAAEEAEAIGAEMQKRARRAIRMDRVMRADEARAVLNERGRKVKTRRA